MISIIRKQTFTTKLIVACVALAGMLLISLLLGASHTTMNDVWLALFSKQSTESATIIHDIRLPREIGAVFVGAALAVSGAIMQALTRNPLAEPGLLGLSAGASAMLAISFALFPSLSYVGIIAACFIGALIGTVMVFSISAAKKGAMSPFRIVLAGAAVSAFLYAVEQGVGLYFKVSKDISMWTAGGLIGTSWTQLQMMIPFIVGAILIAVIFSRQLTILSLDENVAIGLGQNIGLIKAVLFAIVTILTGTAVALVGNIAFVGLMVPHIVRAITGTDYRYIIPMSAIIGAILMVFADTVARTINAPYETPVIAVVALLGLPFFLVITRKGAHFS